MASQAGRSHNSKMSDQKREKLLDIQRREQLKGMLINKFKLKYGDQANISKYIDNEVAKFLKNDRLSEDNLKRLDDKINKEAELRLKKEGIVADRQSQREADARSIHSRGSQRPGTTASNRAAQAAAQNMMETQSQKSVASSRMSGASRLSKPSVAEIRGTKLGQDSQKADSRADAMSWTSS